MEIKLKTMEDCREEINKAFNGVNPLDTSDMMKRLSQLLNDIKSDLLFAWLAENGIPASGIELVEQRKEHETTWFYRSKDYEKCDHALGIEQGYNNAPASIILNSEYQTSPNRFCIDESFKHCPLCGAKLIKE